MGKASELGSELGTGVRHRGRLRTGQLVERDAHRRIFGIKNRAAESGR